MDSQPVPANEQSAEDVLKHYGLNTEYGWIVWRTAFSWVTSRKPQITSLNITLKHDAIPVPGFHFHVQADEKRQIEFTEKDCSTWSALSSF